MKVGLVSPYDFATAGGVNDQNRGGIPAGPLSTVNHWVAFGSTRLGTAEMNPAYSRDSSNR
jgi:hypothetical protein